VLETGSAYTALAKQRSKTTLLHQQHPTRPLPPNSAAIMTDAVAGDSMRLHCSVQCLSPGLLPNGC